MMYSSNTDSPTHVGFNQNLVIEVKLCHSENVESKLIAEFFRWLCLK